MKIRTAVTIGTGAAVGFFLGCFVNENTKEEIASGLRRKLIKALGGEMLKKKGPVNYSGMNYANYYSEKNRNDERDKIIRAWNGGMKQNLLRFETEDKKQSVVRNLKQMAKEYGCVTIRDLIFFENVLPEKYRDLELCRWGWTDEDILYRLVELGDEIILPVPKKLY